MIIEWTRGHILLEMDGKLVKVYGEGLLVQPGEVCYEVYTNSIKKYEAPHENEIIKEKDKMRIIDIIKNYAIEKNMVIEFEV